MSIRTVFIAFFLLAAPAVFAQTFRVYGKVTTSKLEPLPFASVQLKNAQFGILTKEDGTYEMQLAPGTYDLVFTMVGYKGVVIPLVVKEDFEQNVILEEDDAKSMDEIVIRAKAKDRAEEVMRKLVQQKDSIQSAAGAYSAKLYIKAVQLDSGFASKKDYDPLDLRGMNLSEIAIRLDKGKDGEIKEERLGVRKDGDPKSLFYLSATEGNFDFYNNLIKVPAISPTPFVSPVSYSGLVAYRFKTLKVQRTGKHRIYTISVKPRALTNATVEGEITVSDSTWSILSCRFRFPSYHLQEYDFFEVAQDHGVINNQAWMLTRQEFNYYSKTKGGRLSGQTVVRYTDYELNKNFSRRHFGTEVSATASSAYQQDSSFWNTVRKEPLSEKEIHYIRRQDSLAAVYNTKHFKDSIESVINKVTWKRILIAGQGFYKHATDRTWYIDPVRSMFKPFAFGGLRFSPTVSYHRIFPDRTGVDVYANISYGFRNNDVNGTVSVNRLYNPFNRGFVTVSAGRDFQFIYQGDAWINMLRPSNFYLNNAFGVGHGLELFNGLFFFTDVELALRRSVSNYKTGKLADDVLDGDENPAVAFEPYNAFYGKVKLEYTPRQKYVREPREKIILGSKWPTFYAEWRKGIPGLLQSKVDFDYIEYGVKQKVNFGLMGIMNYTVKTGNFFNTRDLRLIDYKFIRRGDPLYFSNPNNTFQAMDSTFPVFSRFWESHLVHDFNGFFLNKIPLFKKLKLREVGGAGFIVAKERLLRYAEAFVGVERAFKSPFDPLDKFKLGVYIVSSAVNKTANPVQFKIGFTTWDKRRNKWF
jgi:hypothetical protein